MTRIPLTLGALVALFLASPAWSPAQQPPSANELIVEASRLIRAAESAITPEQTISLLGAAQRTLELLTEVHPASDLAVKLATGQGIGTVSLAGVQAALKAATAQCWTSLSLLCVARLTLDATPSSEDAPYERVDYLIRVATAQMKAGASEDARATLKIAATVILSEKYEELRAHSLSDIAIAQAEAGQFGDAVKTAELIEDDSLRAFTLLAVAAAQRKAGQAEAAQRLRATVLAWAASLDDADARASILARVAAAQAEAGQFSDAVKTAVSIDAADDRAFSLAQVAAAQAEAGQFSAAIETAASIKAVRRRINALLAIAALQTKAGHVEAARTTLKRAAAAARAIPDPYARVRGALTALAAAYIDMGEEESARATIDQAVAAVQSAPQSEGASSRVSALRAIATAQTKAGQVAAAQQTLATAVEAAQAIAAAEERLNTFVRIAAAQEKAGAIAAAQQTLATAFEAAQAIAAVSRRLWWFSVIAKAQAAAGNAAGARVTIDTAMRHFRAAPKDDGSVLACVFSLCEAPLDADQLAAVMASIKSPEFKKAFDSGTWRMMARHGHDRLRYGEKDLWALLMRANTGAVSCGMEVLKLSENTRVRDGLLSDLVSIPVRAARFAEAIKMARLIEGLDERISSLADIARAQAKGGQVEAVRATSGLALEAAKSSRGASALFLSGLAEAQVEVGLVGDAKNTLREALRATQSRTEHWRDYNPAFSLAQILRGLLEMHDASLL